MWEAYSATAALHTDSMEEVGSEVPAPGSLLTREEKEKLSCGQPACLMLGSNLLLISKF